MDTIKGREQFNLLIYRTSVVALLIFKSIHVTCELKNRSLYLRAIPFRSQIENPSRDPEPSEIRPGPKRALDTFPLIALWHLLMGLLHGISSLTRFNRWKGGSIKRTYLYYLWPIRRVERPDFLFHNLRYSCMM
ncbi:hypothetical protein CEXT_663361 [Caerostris extrusa]|uniref:Uncharacterized protein n=1 Tax=Caerostris extrusa TaxID=172846 RepID=A0AAV4MB21_CAEEX|nr:hypothetical protein CEXT_663361 [Caerostris extrusa]